MKTLSLAIIFATLSLNMAHAQHYDVTIHPDPFWSSYYAASNGFNQGFANAMTLNANEAMVNAYREAHGLPRCSMKLIPQMLGKPAC